MADNEALVNHMLDDNAFKQVLADYYLTRVYEWARAS